MRGSVEYRDKLGIFTTSSPAVPRLSFFASKVLHVSMCETEGLKREGVRQQQLGTSDLSKMHTRYKTQTENKHLFRQIRDQMSFYNLPSVAQSLLRGFF